MVPSFAAMKRLRRALILVGILAVMGYGGAMLWLVVEETAIVFDPKPLGDLRPAAPFEDVTIDRPAEPRQRLWIMRTPADSPSRPWVLYLHGNASNIASRLNILHCERLRALGLNVIAAEYRGFGGTDGAPTESGVERDAASAYDYLRRQLRADPPRIVIYGWSLGSAVAVDLASHVDEAALVLEGAPASLVAIGARRYPYFPIRMLIRNPFESIKKIDKAASPVLFLHSREDLVIPFDEGRRLFDAAQPPKQFVEVAGGHVYASERDPAFFPAIRSFLQAQRVLP
jgi:pimeloyl-ACP methyl ester carboxylesterase